MGKKPRRTGTNGNGISDEQLVLFQLAMRRSHQRTAYSQYRCDELVQRSYPVKAQGMGGRQVRTGKEFGEIYDHHYVEFHYADGTILNSQCRHIKGTYAIVDEMMVGTKGVVKCGAMQNRSKGKTLYQYD